MSEMYSIRAADGTPLAQTIELTEQDAKDAARLLSILLSRPHARVRITDRQQFLIARAEQIIKNRMRRSAHFNPAMFGEAAWDMLLTLYVTDVAGARFKIGDITKASGSPATTALRWLDYLESQQLVRRFTHPNDLRASLVELSDKGRAQFEAYLSEIGE